jgi:hypothetical protein
MKMKWDLINIQEKSDNIHNNKFKCKSIISKEVGIKKQKHKFVTLICNTCNYENTVRISSHINSKTGCPSCSNKLTWTLERAKIEVNKIHKNKFIVHDIHIKKSKNNKKISYVDLECIDCSHRNLVSISNTISNKKSCRNCAINIWNIETAQNESDKIHNKKFLLSNIKIKKYGNKNQSSTHVDITCKDCGYTNNILISNHIYNNQGCGGKCNIKGQRQVQIETLKNDCILANQTYKLYFLKFTHKITNEQFYKVGKTRNNIKKRFRSKEYNNYIIEEVQVVEATHLWVAEQEDIFINKHKDYQYIPDEKFDGYTECFKLEIKNNFKETI